MSKFDENYFKVLTSAKEAGEDGLSFHQIAQEYSLDWEVVLACLKRGLKNRELLIGLDEKIRYRFDRKSKP